MPGLLDAAADLPAFRVVPPSKQITPGDLKLPDDSRLTFVRFGRTLRTCICRCACGVEREFISKHVRSGHTKSCGCSKAAWCGEAKRTHGETAGRIKSKEYKIYRAMIGRCFDDYRDRWHRYGGRGITVCSRWLESFENFLADMGRCPPGMTLERDDNDGDYTPDNCRWATGKEQARNRRTNRLLTHGGRTMCLTAWAEEMQIKRETLSFWLKTRSLTEIVTSLEKNDG